MIYFHQKPNNVLTRLAKLTKIPDLHKMLEKSTGGLKRKIIEEFFEG